MDPATLTAPLSEREQPAAISKLMVQTLTTCAGRGPETVRAHVTAEVVTIVMHNSLCQAERSVIAAGQADIVTLSRRAIQTAMKDDLVAGIETITGRRVAAFLSDHDVLTDVSIEAFVLN